MEERLQKLLSRWGVASRRRAEQIIRSGRVCINGEIAELGQKADPEKDIIELDGQKLTLQNRPENHYYLLHKPLGIISSCQDPQGRRTVIDLLPQDARKDGVHPVGRLDYNSTGALLLTNDGELTYQLTHPRHHIPKTYDVVVAGELSADRIDSWRKGLVLEGRRTLPAEVAVISATSKYTELKITLWEGRNRQIRRIAEYLGHPVKKLHRVSIGSIGLGNLRLGQARHLMKSEIAQLKRTTREKFAVNDAT